MQQELQKARYAVNDPNGDVAPQFRAHPVFSLRNMTYKRCGVPLVDPAITDPVAIPGLLAPFPAQQVTDWFSFFYGAPTHSLTLRPRNPNGCCCPSQYEFDVASGISVPAFGQATMSVPPKILKYLCWTAPKCCTHLDCVCCEQPVEVQFGGKRPPLRGTFRQCFFDCSVCEPSKKIQWESGEEAKFLPASQCWIGSTPSEEGRGSVRYLQGNLPQCDLCCCCRSCCVCCRPSSCTASCCSCCSCCAPTHINRITGVPKSQTFFRDAVLESYHIKYKSAWKTAQPVGSEIVEENHFPIDINGVGNYRIHIEQNLCGAQFVDVTSAASVEEATAIDMWFRGSKNQNVLDESDLNIMLALSLLRGYELLRNGPQTAAGMGEEGEIRTSQCMV